MDRAYGLEIPLGLEEACTPQRTALLVYDMQVGILGQLKNGQEMVERVKTVLDAARIPARDLARARFFYSSKLGLDPVEERPGGLRYRCGSSYFVLFESSGSASGNHTQMSWEVNDIQATVNELRCRGVVFEEYDLPGLKTINGIAEISGNYPSKGSAGERGAWFKDSEGNLLSIGQPIR